MTKYKELELLSELMNSVEYGSKQWKEYQKEYKLITKSLKIQTYNKNIH